MKTVLAMLLASSLALSGCSRPQTAARSDTLYQVSTLSALMQGVYDGETTVKELTVHGDLGIGTFDALDGEMAVLDGQVYQIRADGKARPAAPDVKIPFATVAFFKTDGQWTLPQGTTYETLEKFLDERLKTANYPVALRITGVFSYMKTRCPPRQSKPYKPLAEALANQPTFEFHEQAGVLVGFRLPKYFAQMNVPGYHLHFLTSDRTAGGHALAFTVKSATVEAHYCEDVRITLPRNESFGGAALKQASETELNQVERARK